MNIVTLHPNVTFWYHDGLGDIAVGGIDEVGDGVALHPEHALDDRLARILRRDELHEVPGRHPAVPRAQLVGDHQIPHYVDRRQHAGAPWVCEADDALVDDGDAAENYDGAGDGTLDDGAPRGAGKAPHETGHGGGGDGDEGGRVSPLVPLFLVRRAACILGR